MVFVHLGQGAPPTLEAFSKLPRIDNSNLRRVLITDRLSTQLKFDGEVIIWKEISQASNALLKKRRYYLKLADGYWLNTFERIFALRALANLQASASVPIIHLESDVMPLFNLTDIDFLSRNFLDVAIPRFSERRGIGSFMFSPNIQKLTSTLDKLEALAIENYEWLENDMELLGLALNKGLMMELPSHPSDYEARTYTLQKNHKVLFDGAALGQYLFGQDPFHQSGLRVSGFKNPSYFLRAKINSMFWQIELNQEETNLIVDFDKVRYKVANIHIHSKEVLPPLSVSSKRWKRAIDEANGNVLRIQERSMHTSPHSKKPNLWVRFEIAKTKGIKFAIVRYFIKRLKWKS